MASHQESATSGKYALTYQKRLHYPWEYRRFFTGSEVFKLSECIVFRIENGRDYFRLGITLKARGTSVQRNRVKRAIREAFRRQGDALQGFDVNVVVPATKKMAHPYPERLRGCLKEKLPLVSIRK